MQKGRYSKFIRPISIFFDISMVFFLFPYFFEGLNLDLFIFGIYLLFIWLIASFFSKFYQVYRYTTPVDILSKTIKQAVLFFVL